MRAVILFLIFISFSSYGFVCRNMRLDKPQKGFNKGGRPKYLTMQGAPTQRQSLGICYSYSATQIMDAVKRKRNLEKGKPAGNLIGSPIYTAVNTSDEWDGVTYRPNGTPRFPFEGGFTCPAFNKAKETNYCPKSAIDDFLKKKGMDEAEFMTLMYEAEKNFKEQKSKLQKEYFDEFYSRMILTRTDPLGSSGYLDILEQVYCEKDCLREKVRMCENRIENKLYEDLRKVFGTALMPTREIFMKFFNDELFQEPLSFSLFFRWICKGKTKKVNTNQNCKDFTVKEMFRSKNKEKYGTKYPFTRKILEQLERDSLPVGILYCSKVLKKGKSFVGIQSKSIDGVKFKKTSSGENMCGNHASVVIGSRWNKKKKTCELLVKNSWGPACKYKDGKLKYSSDWNCENGSLWVDYKTLEKNMYGVEYL